MALNLNKDNLKEILKNFIAEDYKGSEINIGSNIIELANKRIENLSDDVFDGADYKDIKKLNLENNLINVISPRKFKGLENLLELHLSKNKLYKTSSNSFSYLLNLRILNLNENLIRKISSNSFNGLKFLTKLNLSGNKLSHLNDSLFNELKNLKVLDLNQNNLSTVNDALFINLKCLQGLNLSNNQIDIIDENAFSNLESLIELRLERNKLSNVSDQLLKFQTNLLKLNLSENKLNCISENAFLSLKKLRYINLSNNKLACMPNEMFKNQKAIEVIDLSSNNLTTINSKFFDSLTSLTKLYLTNNKIYYIEQNSFSRLEHLIKLFLNKNSIKALQGVFFNGLKNLTTLNLSENEINKVEENVFFGLENLSEIDLSNNLPICELQDEIFKFQKNLQFLDMSNLKLNRLCFQNLTFLVKLVLSDNRLEVIKDLTFSSMKNLKTLYLDNNKICLIEDDAFMGLETLNHLYLNKNKLKSIRSRQLFHLTSLYHLDISSNEIFLLEDDVFRRMYQLNSLLISNNKINSINDQLFKGLDNLTSLYFESNNIDYIHDDAFKDLDNLKQLDFYQNKIKSLNENMFLNLHNLENLNLSSNLIPSISNDLFKNLINVKDLELDDNQIYAINTEHFKNMRSLEKIRLDYNKIELLSPFTFSNLKQLKHIELKENKIETVDSKAFWDLTNLKKINLSNNRIRNLRSEAFGNFEIMNSLEEINLNGNDRIEFIDLLTLVKLIKLDKSNLSLYKKFKLKGIDFFPGGLNKITNEVVDELVKYAYEVNYSNLFGAGVLLKWAIYLDDSNRTDQNKKILADYFRMNSEKNKFNGFTKIWGFKNDSIERFISSYLRENLVSDIYYESLMKSETQMFEIFHESMLEFENDILINLLKQNEFNKFENLIKRFTVLSKESVKSNSYYILCNSLFWTNDKNETIFNYIIGNEINNQNDLLDLLFSLHGLYLRKCKNDFLILSTDLEEKFENAGNDIEIYKTMLLLNNSSKCLIYSVAKLDSNKTLSFLLKDKEQLKLLTKSENSLCGMEQCIQEKIEKISNNKLKQILDKYLSLCVEGRNPLTLNVKSIECLAVRNDSGLFKKFFDNTRFFELRNATNSVLKIAMGNENERIAEFFLDKLIELKINDFEKNIVTYETISELFRMKWWKEIEKLLNSFESTRLKIFNDDSNQIELVVSQSLNSNLNSILNSSLDETDDLKQNNGVIYQSLPHMDREIESNNKGFNFVCLDCDEGGNKEHVLMIVAKSGKPNIIQHDVVLRLVNLKWRYIPRFVYHSQTLMHLTFLVLFLTYVLNEFEIITNQLNLVNQTNETNSTITIEQKDGNSNYFVLVISTVLVVYFLIYEISEAVTEKFAYFFSIKNWLEFLTYLFALVVLITIKFESFFQMTSMLSSLSVLFGFIVLMLRLEKNSTFGAYVVAFRRSFAKTVKTLPFIILLFFGFIYSFLLRTNTGVKFISSSSVNHYDYLSMAKMTNMIIGSYELDLLGLNSSSFINEIINFFIYFNFLILMTIISVNLLTGIAIGELETVLKQAEIYNIQQRISYILRIQKIIVFIEKLAGNKCKIFSNLMILSKEDEKSHRSKKILLQKMINWFKKHSKSEIKFIETTEKETNEYLIEAEYNSRVNRDFMTNKMNENEFKLTCLAENIETFKNDQMKKVNDIDLNVSKLEKQFSDLNEAQMKKVNVLDAKLEIMSKQIAEILNLLHKK